MDRDVISGYDRSLSNGLSMTCNRMSIGRTNKIRIPPNILYCGCPDMRLLLQYDRIDVLNSWLCYCCSNITVLVSASTARVPGTSRTGMKYYSRLVSYCMIVPTDFFFPYMGFLF